VSREEVQVLVKEFGGMVNVKMNLREGYLGVKEIRELGVARVSLGPELWKCAMKAVKEQAELLLA
jgi:2-methylisocitrate lyase-like PEP mutase family enzyme